MQRVGLIFLDRPGLSEQIRLAQRAEERGFDSVWVCETRLVRDGITPLAAFATATQRIKLATGVVNTWTRTAALMAMTFATLAELAPGRVMLGIGAYWDPLAWKQGIERRKLLTAMREYVYVVRRLLALETVTLEGEVTKVRELRLDLGADTPQQPIRVPIYIGATGPKMMALAGEIADGIFHNFFTSTQYLRASLQRARKGADKAGRPVEEVDMPQMIAVAMSRDPREARDAARHPLAMYIGQQPHIALASGVDPEACTADSGHDGWLAPQARDRGVPVFAETCPQYLFLSYDDYERPGFEGAKFVMSPPLRPKGNEERLWRGLNSNNLQVVSTDHCPFCFDKPQGKRLGEGDFSLIPNGAPGVETRLHLLYDGGVNQGRFSVNRMVDLLATTPARLFGLYPQKGTIAPGSDADLVIFDPEKKHRISHKTTHMNVDYSPYEGREVTGAVESVLLRGRVILEKGNFAGRAGDGRFIKRSPSEPSRLL